MADLKGAMDGQRPTEALRIAAPMSDFRPTRGKSMKFFVASICALALSSAAIAQNISAEDFDLACAVTAGAIFGSNPKAERDASKTVWTFYLGRLTGRDDKTIWNTVIKGRIAAMGEKAKSEEFYGKCIDFYTIKTTE
jgi:hypothetical protein